MPIGKKKAQEIAAKKKAKEEEKKAKQEQEEKLWTSKKKSAKPQKKEKVSRLSNAKGKLSQLSIAPTTGQVCPVYTDVDDEDPEDMPEHEIRRFMEQVYASDGFDVDDFSHYMMFGLIVPMELTNHTINYATPFAKVALDDYNQKENANFEFEEIEKVNGQAGGGVTLFITFKGRHRDTGELKSFQGKVFDAGLPRDGVELMSVEFCRLKRTAKI